jgi:hypothetical protein
MRQTILFVMILFLSFISKAQNSEQPLDSINFDSDRYFYYLDVIRDYLCAYPISKDLFALSISAVEDITKIKCTIIMEDFSFNWTASDYKQDMMKWIDWYIQSICKLSKHEQKKLYKRYIPIKQRKKYRCPCHKNSKT